LVDKAIRAGFMDGDLLARVRHANAAFLFDTARKLATLGVRIGDYLDEAKELPEGTNG